MDVPDYAAGIRHKTDVYRANGVPAVFVYTEDLAQPCWPDAVIKVIRRTFSGCTKPPPTVSPQRDLCHSEDKL
jgi:hypothetical protein